MPRRCWQKARKRYITLCAGARRPPKPGEFCGPIARRAIPFWAGACARRASLPARAIVCWPAGQGRFLAACALGTGRTHQIRVHFSHAGCRFWATGCTAVMHRRWGGRPSLRRAVLYNARGRACGPGGCAGVCAAAAGYGRPGLPAWCPGRRAAGQAWCGACICAPRVALKCEKGYNILVTFQAMPAIALRKAGRKGGGGNGAKA